MVEKLNLKNKPDESSSNLHEDFNNVKQALGDVSRDMKEKASDFIAQSYENAKDASYKKADDLSNYISNRPLKAVGFSLLVGFLIGRFVR